MALARHWETHPNYGHQFKVDHVEVEMPDAPEELARYIANHPEVKGIGSTHAAKIAPAFRKEFESMFIRSPECMTVLAKQEEAPPEGEARLSVTVLAARHPWVAAHSTGAPFSTSSRMSSALSDFVTFNHSFGMVPSTTSVLCPSLPEVPTCGLRAGCRAARYGAREYCNK